VSYLFGPVPSRRLGFSLGLDIVKKKTCTLDCVYCQVGATGEKTLERSGYVDVRKVLSELKKVLKQKKKLNYITFSGSGEPTLSTELGACIRGIRKLTDTPVCVIINGTLLGRKDVREDLALADLVIPSLDAVSEDVFQAINRPHPDLSAAAHLEGLKVFRAEFAGQFWPEIMLVKGINDRPEELLKLSQAASAIKPDKVQLNTVARLPQDPSAQPLTRIDLEKIAAMFGADSELIPDFSRREIHGEQIDMEQTVLELVRRRSITVSDIVKTTGLTKREVLELMEDLARRKKVKKAVFSGQAYYREYY